MSTARALWAEHQDLVAFAGACLLLGWVLVRAVAGALVWARARRHARTAAGCTGCGAARVAVVAYPTRTSPRPYCDACLDAWPDDGAELPPMVGLSRPVDPVGLAGQSVAMVFAVATAVLLMIWAGVS